MTRIDEPDQTLDPVVVLAERGIEIEDQVALPALIEPSETPLVTEPVNESLVPVEHPRIIHLDQHRIAGWRHAIAGSFLRRGTAVRLAAVVENLPERWSLCPAVYGSTRWG